MFQYCKFNKIVGTLDQLIESFVLLLFFRTDTKSLLDYDRHTKTGSRIEER